MKLPKKIQRILAVLSIVLLAGLYLCSLIFAMFDTPGAQMMFRACVAATIIVPVLLYMFILVYKQRKNSHDGKKQEEEEY